MENTVAKMCKLDIERERNRWKRDGSLGQPLKNNPEWCMTF
jgi:hypothetical protein